MAKEKTAVIDLKMFCGADDMLEEETNNSCIPVGPAIDDKLKGGIKEGSLVLIRTLAKVGKSTIAMQIAQNALKQGRYVIYADVERRLSGKKYFQIYGWDNSNKKFMVLRSQENKKILSGEEIYKTIKDMMMLPEYNGAVYIIDSFSKIIPNETLIDEEIKSNRRDGTPKLNADFCKKVGNLVRTTKSVVIGIQHFITNTSGYGDPLVADGGVKLEYECDIVLEARHKPFGWDGKRLNSENILGQLINFQIPYNKLGPPYVCKDSPIECYIKFGEGIWWEKEVIPILQEMGLLITAGSWNTLILPEGEIRIQGADNLILELENKRETLEPLIQKHFTEKYGANYDFKDSGESEQPEPSKKKGGKTKE